MSSERQIHKELRDISPDHFPIWNETLGYDRGLDQFRQPPDFSEEGILVPTTGEYTCRRRRGVVPLMQTNSQLSPSPIGQVEFENSSPIALPPSLNEGNNNPIPGTWPWEPLQPLETESTTTLPEELNAFLDYGLMHEIPMEEDEEQANAPVILMPSTPTQSDPHGPVPDIWQ